MIIKDTSGSGLTVTSHPLQQRKRPKYGMQWSLSSVHFLFYFAAIGMQLRNISCETLSLHQTATIQLATRTNVVSRGEAGFSQTFVRGGIPTKVVVGCPADYRA